MNKRNFIKTTLAGIFGFLLPKKSEAETTVSPKEYFDNLLKSREFNKSLLKSLEDLYWEEQLKDVIPRYREEIKKERENKLEKVCSLCKRTKYYYIDENGFKRCTYCQCAILDTYKSQFLEMDDTPKSYKTTVTDIHGKFPPSIIDLYERDVEVVAKILKERDKDG